MALRIASQRATIARMKGHKHPVKTVRQVLKQPKLPGDDITIQLPSPRAQKAIRSMVWDGLKRTDAAKRAGIAQGTLDHALRTQHGRAFLRREYAAMRSGQLPLAYARQVQLAESSESDQVKLAANKWLAGVEGVAPVKVARQTISVTHGFEGYTYDAPSADRSSPDAEDAEVVDSES